jgi:hypothetical protein
MLDALGTRNGIDYVEIANGQTVLRVHFMTPAPDEAALAAAVTGATITGGETITEVAVRPAASWTWGTAADGRPVVELSVEAPGDFSTYTLALQTNAAVLDPYFDHVPFSFKAGCPSSIDCLPAPAAAAPDGSGPPIDYLAKDFDSFRRALLDFSTRQYPAWQERSEADFGVMFLEALASVADDLSYQQDRLAAEAWLETATQRRSLAHLARLVDYEPGVATAATTTLQFQMAASGAIPAGIVVSALAADGSLVAFETGTGLSDDGSYEAHPEWNALEAYWFDDAERILPPGATTLWIRRPAVPLQAGQAVLVEAASPWPGDPPLRALVTLATDPVDDVDPVFGPQPVGTPVTRLTWSAAEALPFAADLASTTVRGNLVPATHGRRQVDRFVTTTTWTGLPGPARATVRTGPNGSLQFLHTLEQAPLAWLLSADGAAHPELSVTEARTGRWDYQPRWLSGRPLEQIFALEPMRYRLLDPGIGAFDYDGDDGTTLRFGDGERGAIPAEGASFVVTYRVGGGLRGNVAADTLNRVDPVIANALGITSVSNPLAVVDGRDEEPADQVRDLAPHAFRSVQYRAVRASDYEEAVERELAWAQRAGTSFRYTGSWLSVFTAIDPRGTERLAPDKAVAATELLDRYRLAGYESYILEPRYASLDIRVAVCARPDAFRGDVERGALAALTEFFEPDQFTFGAPLERSALEAALQDVPGLDGVTEVTYRRRGHTPGFVRMLDTVDVARDEIVRADNDPSRPEAGSLHVDVGGGK